MRKLALFALVGVLLLGTIVVAQAADGVSAGVGIYDSSGSLGNGYDVQASYTKGNYKAEVVYVGGLSRSASAMGITAKEEASALYVGPLGVTGQKNRLSGSLSVGVARSWAKLSLSMSGDTASISDRDTNVAARLGVAYDCGKSVSVELAALGTGAKETSGASLNVVKRF